jgi:hypothetical protein
MADKTYYAWSNIHYHDTNEKKQIAKPGTEVTKDMLGESDEGWVALLEGGAIRTTPWPEGLDPSNPNALSPNEHRLKLLRLERERLEAEMAGVGGSVADTNPSAVDEDDDNEPSSVFGGGQ